MRNAWLDALVYRSDTELFCYTQLDGVSSRSPPQAIAQQLELRSPETYAANHELVMSLRRAEMSGTSAREELCRVQAHERLAKKDLDELAGDIEYVRRSEMLAIDEAKRMRDVVGDLSTHMKTLMASYGTLVEGLEGVCASVRAITGRSGVAGVDSDVDALVKTAYDFMQALTDVRSFVRDGLQGFVRV